MQKKSLENIVAFYFLTVTFLTLVTRFTFIYFQFDLLGPVMNSQFHVLHFDDFLCQVPQPQP